MSYYRAKVEDISSVEVRQITEDLYRAVDWPVGENNNLRMHDWLVHFFQHFSGSAITQKHIPWVSPLTTKIRKLAGTEVHVFCAELCRASNEGLELHDNKTVLSLLKALYDAPHKRLKKFQKPTLRIHRR